MYIYIYYIVRERKALIVLCLASLKIKNGNQSSNPHEAISYCANNLGKRMDPTILLPAMGKIVGYTGLINLDIAIGVGKGKLCTETYP